MTQAAQYQRIWEMADSQSAESSQEWILSAMNTHGAALVTMLWRILGNEQDVCDAYQDTFLQLAHCRRGQKPDKVKAYLFRTASNTAVSLLRRKIKHNKACEIISHNCQVDHQVDYGGDLDAKELQLKLRVEITRLPTHLREVIVLHDLGNLPYRQVAGMLKIGINSSNISLSGYQVIGDSVVRSGKRQVNTMWLSANNNCKNTRNRLAQVGEPRFRGHAGWLHKHIAQCPRCQERLKGYNRLSLALSLLKAQSHNVNLLARANCQVVKVLQRSLRERPKAEQLKQAQPQPNWWQRCHRYSQAVRNAAACFAVLLMMRTGIFWSMEKFHLRGQKAYRNYFARNLGEDSSIVDELFEA